MWDKFYEHGMSMDGDRVESLVNIKEPTDSFNVWKHLQV